MKIIIEGNIEKQLTNENINKTNMPVSAMAAGKSRK